MSRCRQQGLSRAWDAYAVPARLTALCDHGCVIRRPHRVVRRTEHGAATLAEHLDLDLQALGAEPRRLKRGGNPWV
jgi:hypothetical protein